MSQNAAADSGPPAPAVTVSSDEDAGRLNHASNARIWTILIVLVVFTEVIPVQYAMVGLIIPKIGLAFPTAGANSTWALTIVGVVGAATLPLCGKASDLWGKKRTAADPRRAPVHRDADLRGHQQLGAVPGRARPDGHLLLHVGRRLRRRPRPHAAPADPGRDGRHRHRLRRVRHPRAGDRRAADRPLQLAVDLLVPAHLRRRHQPAAGPGRARVPVPGTAAARLARRPPHRVRPRRGAHLRQRGQQLGLGHRQQPDLPDRRPGAARGLRGCGRTASTTR